MPADLLAELKKLQHQRSESSPFESHIEYMQWADKVTGLLAFDEKTRYKFEYYVKLAKFKNNTNCSPLEAINESIGVLNQAITALENKPSLINEIVPVPDAAPQPAASNTNAEKNWYARPIGLIGIGIVITILGALAVYLLKTHLGLPL